jgi:hypothetical protein
MSKNNQAGGLILVGLFLFVLSGCASFLHEIPQPSLEHQQVFLKKVPFYPQERYQCGPASLAMVLGWSGIAVQPDELVKEVFSPGRRGSLQSDLISAVRRHGRIAYPVSGIKSLTDELAAGHPVIVLLNLGFFWYPKWHYAVVVGYDMPAGEFILHSGNNENERLSFRVFNNLWSRSEKWGLLVLPPSQFAAEVQKDTWLEAVVGLERAKQWSAAITAYEMAITLWPESYGAWIGLGNSRYATGDLAEAASAFRQASYVNQENGIAFNNLAQVLWEMGRHKEALAAARQAIILGGPLVEEFKQTLYAIEARPKR